MALFKIINELYKEFECDKTTQNKKVTEEKNLIDQIIKLSLSPFPPLTLLELSKKLDEPVEKLKSLPIVKELYGNAINESSYSPEEIPQRTKEVEITSLDVQELPYLDKYGELVIPFSCNKKYKWWDKGQSIKKTIEELRNKCE